MTTLRWGCVTTLEKRQKTKYEGMPGVGMIALQFLTGGHCTSKVHRTLHFCSSLSPIICEKVTIFLNSLLPALSP
jgi:hypothetical protein